MWFISWYVDNDIISGLVDICNRIPSAVILKHDDDYSTCPCKPTRHRNENTKTKMGPMRTI